MPKAAAVPTLNLTSSKNAPSSPHIGASSVPSLDSPQSPRSPPQSPAYTSEDAQLRAESAATSPRIGALPDPPLSPGRVSPKQHSRDASKSFFGNLMASKSSHKLQTQSPDSSVVEVPEKQSRSRGTSKDRSMHSVRKQTSTPDLPRLMTSNGTSEGVAEQVPSMLTDPNAPKQKTKSKLGGILARSRSGKPEEERKQKQRPPTQLNLAIHPPPDRDDEFAIPLKTAPVKPNYSRDHLHANEGAMIRNRSADRTGHEDSRTNGNHLTGSHRDGASLFGHIQQTGKGMSDRLGKAGRGLFNKIARSGSTNERELIPDEHYVCTTINLPLIKQTRRTRIAKKLELSKDKTEYWMPALPWRCIDYLNMQCEQEGLYRVPGSGRDVKFWQRRFDTDHDINLFEEPELYDVNTIASMFKAWLRDLPDELFPKSTQARIAKECAGAQKTPQLLKDELSKLPPFNYYLLFAITCHLSLLHSYADQNKMDYRNLCICFQPCLKIDAFCFQFLVIDWKECWQQGCWTEKEYLEEERRYERDGSVSVTAPADSDISMNQAPGVEERAHSSSNSSTHLQSAPQNAGMPPRSADGLHSRPTTTQSQLQPKQRSLSSSGKDRTRAPNHGQSNHGQTSHIQANHGQAIHSQTNYVQTSQGRSGTPPIVPRLISKTQTPEQMPAPDSSLPELGNMSPIRM